MTAYSWKDVRMTIGGENVPISTLEASSIEDRATQRIVDELKLPFLEPQRPRCTRRRDKRFRKLLVRIAGDVARKRGLPISAIVQAGREMGARIPRSLGHLCYHRTYSFTASFRMTDESFELWKAFQARLTSNTTPEQSPDTSPLP